MKHFESVKRIIILQLAVIGLLMQTIAYVYVWRTVYNDYAEIYVEKFYGQRLLASGSSLSGHFCCSSRAHMED